MQVVKEREMRLLALSELLNKRYHNTMSSNWGFRILWKWRAVVTEKWDETTERESADLEFENLKPNCNVHNDLAAANLVVLIFFVD